MTDLEIKNCENCNKPFVRGRFWQKYCTPACRNASYWKHRDQKIQAQAADPLDALLMNDLSGPTPAQEAEWLRRSALADVEGEKREHEEARRRKFEAEEAIRKSGIDAPPTPPVFDFNSWKDKQ